MKKEQRVVTTMLSHYDVVSRYRDTFISLLRNNSAVETKYKCRNNEILRCTLVITI